MAAPLSPLFFNDAQIRFTAHLPGQAVPESLLVASLHTDAMHEVAVFAATGRAMAAGPQLLVALKEAVEVIRSWHGPVAWDIYRDHSPEMKRITAAIQAGEGGAT